LMLDPDNLQVLSAQGGTFVALGKMEDTYRVCRKVLDADDQRAGDWNNMGLALQALRREDEAVEAFQAAIKIDPEYLMAHTHLGSSYQSQGRITEAREAYEKALAINSSSPEALNNLAIISQSMGEFSVALDYLRRATENAPGNAAFHSNILFGIQYLPEGTERMLFDEIMSWGDRHAAPHYNKRKPITNDPNPDRRLRIGYVSPDFKGHSCSYFLYPLFSNHDRKNFEIFSYAEVLAPDVWTDTFKGLSDHWFSTVGLTDDDVANRIRNDKIDVLVDLGAHTAGSRLLVSARKPAPVQVSWLGLGNSTGVRTMDYFISDPHMVPEGYEKYFCEQVYRLPHNTYCYYPLNHMPDVGPLHAKQAGYVTFGTLSRTVRLNTNVLKAWAAIMSRVPNSRLMINTVTMADPLMRDQFAKVFEAEGVSRDRLELIFTRVPHETWGSYNKIDIALDPFPHNAGLTTYEAIYMGAAVVTLADRPPQGRYGASILSNVGLADLVAYNVDEYIDIAVSLATDLDRLASLKSVLRERMLASPLCDGAGYTKAMEDGYRRMWKTWCEDQA
jgi:protein O-GlcNAc transferase